MTLPNYFYGGPPKAGSSWIYNLLATHPEVFVPDGKYVQFFTDFYDRGIDWYAAQYAAAVPAQTARCDLTTDYLFVPEAAERLARHVPEARVFFSLRNPVERDWSAYQHLLRTGQARGPLEREVETAHRLLSQCSAYSDAIERSWRLFGRENTHVLWFEDIRAHPQAAADELFDFLRVSRRAISEDESGAKNVARAARSSALNGVLKQGAIALRAAGLSKVLARLKDSPVVDKMLFSANSVPKLRDSPEAQAFLSRRHAAEIDRLETLLSRDLSAWRMLP
jgi:hypothetical protein